MRQLWDNIQVSLMTGLIEGKRGRGRPRTSSVDNILMWSGLTGTELMSAACDRRSWAERWSIHVGNRRRDDSVMT